MAALAQIRVEWPTVELETRLRQRLRDELLNLFSVIRAGAQTSCVAECLVRQDPDAWGGPTRASRQGSGPLPAVPIEHVAIGVGAFRSDADPLPLTELEQMILVAAATGVSGWNFGGPFGPRTPESHADFTLRFTGRTAADRRRPGHTSTLLHPTSRTFDGVIPAWSAVAWR